MFVYLNPLKSHNWSCPPTYGYSELEPYFPASISQPITCPPHLNTILFLALAKHRTSIYRRLSTSYEKLLPPLYSTLLYCSALHCTALHCTRTESAEISVGAVLCFPRAKSVKQLLHLAVLHYTLNTVHCTLHTAHCTLQTAH